MQPLEDGISFLILLFLHFAGCKRPFHGWVYQLAHLAFCVPHSGGKLEEQVLCGSELGHDSRIWQGQLQDRLISWPSIHCAGSCTLQPCGLKLIVILADKSVLFHAVWWLLLPFCYCHLIFSCYLIVNFIGHWKGRFSQKWCPLLISLILTLCLYSFSSNSYCYSVNVGITESFLHFVP